MADAIGAVIPDDKTRRQAGFDIKKWRERKNAAQKLQAVQRKDGNRSYPVDLGS